MATTWETDEEKEAFEVVRRCEESILEAGRNWATAVAHTMPVELPVVREVVKGAFDFAEEVLKAQREFAHSMLKVTRQVPRASRTASARRATTRTGPTSKAA